MDQGLWQTPEIDLFHLFIPYVNTDNIVMWLTLPNNADWDYFKTLISREILEDSKSTSGGTLCIFGSHTFVPTSWMYQKRTAVSHSSTESEIISLDTRLRLGGLLALELWDLIVSFFWSVSQISDRSGQLDQDVHKHHKFLKEDQCNVKFWFCSFECPIFASRSFIVCLNVAGEAQRIAGCVEIPLVKLDHTANLLGQLPDAVHLKARTLRFCSVPFSVFFLQRGDMWIVK